jgi:hypothetical protein
MRLMLTMAETWAVGKQCENFLRPFERKLCEKCLARNLKMDVRGSGKTLKYLSLLMDMM